MKRARPWVSRFLFIVLTGSLVLSGSPRLEGPLASRMLSHRSEPCSPRRLITFAAFCRPITSPSDRGREFLELRPSCATRIYYSVSTLISYSRSSSLISIFIHGRGYTQIPFVSRLYIGIRSVLDTRTDIRSYFLPFQSASSILRSFDIFLQRR